MAVVADLFLCVADIPLDIMFTNQYYIRFVNNVSLVSQNLTNSVALDFHWDFGVCNFL